MQLSNCAVHFKELHSDIAPQNICKVPPKSTELSIQVQCYVSHFWTLCLALSECRAVVRFGRSEIFPCEPETISCPRALVLLPLNINSPRASIPAFGILTHRTDDYPLRISQCDIPNRCRWIWGNLWRKFYNIRLLCSMQQGCLRTWVGTYVVDRPTQLICISAMSTDKYKIHRRAIC